MSKQGVILICEDDGPQRRMLAGFLSKLGYRVLEAASAAEALNMVEADPPELLLTDLRLGGPDGVELLEKLRQHQSELQALVLTAYGTVEDAVRAMRAGAYDFLQKPVDLDRLELLVEKALEKAHLARENRQLKEYALSAGAFSDLVGESPAMKKIKELAQKLSLSKVTVLIRGESGTGKEVLARLIHRNSERREKPFVAVNCAALPETLIEAELFGHEKGAFTGAMQEKPGRFELADGGTLFLDEVGDIPLPVQVKLLGVLQTGRVERLGARRARKVDVRLIAATHRDLEQLIRERRFREDLYYRINVVPVVMPPLRERREDIPLLLSHFIKKHAHLAPYAIEGVEPELYRHLENLPFRGNVRELENMVERALALCDGPWLGVQDFPLAPAADASFAGVVEVLGGLEEQVARLEISLIRSALEKHRGNKSAAARELGLSERAIRYKINKYRLE